MSAAIEVAGLSKRYEGGRDGGNFALNDVSAVFPEGRVIGLLGHNGAGKSTLIKLMLGLIAPTAGRICVLGMDPGGADGRTVRTRLGYLPENLAFYDNLTGREIITYLARLKKVAVDDGAALLERVGLGDAADQRIGTYSRGMRQRLGLAQVLLGSPDLLLLDEPIAGLDPAATEDFFRLVVELRAAGKSIVISSHQLGELEPHLDRAVILGHGRLLAQGSITELYALAGLSATVTARFGRNGEGHFNGGGGKEELLAGLAVTLRRRERHLLEFDVPASDKMMAIRKLMGLPSLVDLEVRKPTLAHLYETIGTDGAGARKASETEKDR